MQRWCEITAQPPERPEQTGRAADKENPSPAQKLDDRGNCRWSDDCANCCARIDDAHGRRTFMRREPFGDGLGRGRETTAFAHAQQETAYCQHPKSGGQTM